MSSLWLAVLRDGGGWLAVVERSGQGGLGRPLPSNILTLNLQPRYAGYILGILLSFLFLCANDDVILSSLEECCMVLYLWIKGDVASVDIISMSDKVTSFKSSQRTVEL